MFQLVMAARQEKRNPIMYTAVQKEVAHRNEEAGTPSETFCANPACLLSKR